jgi:uncharacterized protein YxjI
MGSVPSVKGRALSEASSLAGSAESDLHRALSRESQLHIRQSEARWTEVIAPRPKFYEILTEAGTPVGEISQETSGGLSGAAGRFVWGGNRKFLMQVSSGGTPVMSVRRNPTWWLPEIEVLDGFGQPVGSVVQGFTMFRSSFEIFESGGRKFGSVANSFFDQWTFKVVSTDGGLPIARIERKWDGIEREILQASSFRLTLMSELSCERALLTLAATLLVDFCCFEGRPVPA